MEDLKGNSQAINIPAGWYEDPANPSNERWWNGWQWTNELRNKNPAAETNQSLESANTPVHQPQQNQIYNIPALRDWKTSVGFSILGWVLFRAIFGSLVTVVSVFSAVIFWQATSSLFYYVPLITCEIAIASLEIVYAAVFYPSYFKEDPVIKSSKVISMLNLMFGDIIFGAIWNANLTNSHNFSTIHKGKSYIVFIVCNSLFIAMYTALLFLCFFAL